jgi:hypothetical protein
MVRAPLWLQTTTETRGQATSAENGVSAKARLTASSASLGWRSRVVNPKSQSSISWPPRNHSSVQAKTKAPLPPAANTVRTCQSSIVACAASLLRRLSSPISAIRSGRSPAKF